MRYDMVLNTDHLDDDTIVRMVIDTVTSNKT